MSDYTFTVTITRWMLARCFLDVVRDMPWRVRLHPLLWWHVIVAIVRGPGA